MSYFLYLFFPFMMIYASTSDLLSMTIPNRISVILLFGFIVFAYWSGMDLKTFALHWGLFAIVLMITILLFAAGVIGGGDAKLIPVTVLWLGWEYSFVYLVYASLFGGLLTLIMLNMRWKPIPIYFEKHDWIARLYRADRGIPYGIALGVAALIIFPETFWMDRIVEAMLHS